MVRAIAARMADTTGTPAPGVVVIGAGVTGLAVAQAIHRARPDARLVVLDERERAGGNIYTERVDGFVLDAGPDSFVRTKPAALELCRELGLESSLVQTREAARHVFVAHQGKLVRLPAGMVLGVPTRLAPLMSTPLLTARGKLRVLAEPLVPRRLSDDDESVEDFLSRRLGNEAATKLAAPLLGGIYAGDVRTLGIQATFPELAAFEHHYGSILRGLMMRERGGGVSPSSRELFSWLRREETSAASPFLSLRGGMGALIDALVEALPPGTLRTGARVTSIERRARGFTVRTAADVFDATSVVVATPAHVASRLVPDGRLAAELAEVTFVSTGTVFFALEQSGARHSLDGLGFIVPAGEARILASTWISSKWDDRAPSGGALVRAFVGGVRDPDRVAKSTDDELVELAQGELERLMGSLGRPRFTRVYRYENANPQPTVNHRARLSRLDARLETLPGLHLVGASYDGVGIPDCIRQARHCASAVLAELATSRDVGILG
jgi:oxygen-dependent protoporphyrinogen oxidase